MKTVERPTIPYLRLMLYGQAGAGKTRLVGTFDQDPRSARCLILNCGGNPISILRNSPMPIVVEMEAAGDFDLPYDFLRRGQPKEHPFRKFVGDAHFNSVAIDHLTEVQRRMIDVILTVGIKPSDTKPMERQDWGRLLRMMTQLVNLYFELPMHVIMTTQEKTEEEVIRTPAGDVTRRAFRIFLQGQSIDVVPAYAELIGRVKRRQKVGPPVEHATSASVAIVDWDTGGQILVKNQVAPALGAHMEEPSATKIFDVVEAYFKPAPTTA